MQEFGRFCSLSPQLGSSVVCSWHWACLVSGPQPLVWPLGRDNWKSWGLPAFCHGRTVVPVIRGPILERAGLTQNQQHKRPHLHLPFTLHMWSLVKILSDRVLPPTLSVCRLSIVWGYKSGRPPQMTACSPLDRQTGAMSVPITKSAKLRKTQ